MTDPAHAVGERDPSDVSRETSEATGPAPLDGSRETAADGILGASDVDVSRETESNSDTPIAREAAQAIEVLNVRQQQWPRPATTRVLTVANQKGGVGKTTSAVNLAAALALHGLRVLVIDLDPQGNASTALGIDHGVGTPSIYDVLLGGQPISDVLHPTTVSPMLQGVPATLDLAGADIELTSQVAREYRLQRAVTAYLEQVEEPPDYLIIDCPPSLGLLTLNALVAGREVLIPIQCEYYALEGLAQLLKTVELVQAHLNPTLAVTTVLLTMYDSRTKLADQVAAEVREHFADLVLAPVIPRNVRVSEAPGFGQTVLTYDAGSRGAVSYLQAAHELAERGRAAPAAARNDLEKAESELADGAAADQPEAPDAAAPQVAGETAGVDDGVDYAMNQSAGAAGAAPAVPAVPPEPDPAHQTPRETSGAAGPAPSQAIDGSPRNDAAGAGSDSIGPTETADGAFPASGASGDESGSWS